MPPRKAKETATSPQQLVPSEDRAGEKAAFISEAYNKVARAAKLNGIMLVRSKFSVDPDFFTSRDTEQRKPTFSYGSKIDSLTFDQEDGIASCEWKWSVRARSGRKTSLSIEADYVVIYDNLAECEAEAVHRFLKRVARFATYPYFRAHVSQVSWESGASLPILPTIAT